MAKGGPPMEKNDQKLNLKRKPKEEVLEWSPTGYGFIAAVQQDDEETDSDDYSWKG